MTFITILSLSDIRPHNPDLGPNQEFQEKRQFFSISLYLFLMFGINALYLVCVFSLIVYNLQQSHLYESVYEFPFINISFGNYVYTSLCLRKYLTAMIKRRVSNFPQKNLRKVKTSNRVVVRFSKYWLNQVPSIQNLLLHNQFLRLIFYFCYQKFHNKYNNCYDCNTVIENNVYFKNDKFSENENYMHRAEHHIYENRKKKKQIKKKKKYSYMNLLLTILTYRINITMLVLYYFMYSVHIPEISYFLCVCTNCLLCAMENAHSHSFAHIRYVHSRYVHRLL